MRIKATMIPQSGGEIYALTALTVCKTISRTDVVFEGVDLVFFEGVGFFFFDGVVSLSCGVELLFEECEFGNRGEDVLLGELEVGNRGEDNGPAQSALASAQASLIEAH